MNPLAFLAPEAVGIGSRARVHVAIFGLIDIGTPAPLRRNVVNLLGNLSCDGVVHWASSTPARAIARAAAVFIPLLCAAARRGQGAPRHTLVAGWRVSARRTHRGSRPR